MSKLTNTDYPESILAEGILLGKSFKRKELLPLLNNEASYTVLKALKETLTDDEKFFLLKKLTRHNQLRECIKFIPYELLKKNICISVNEYASAKLYDDLYLTYMLTYPQEINEMQDMFFYIMKYNSPTIIGELFKESFFNFLDDRNKNILVYRTCQSIYYFGLMHITETTPEGYDLLIKNIMTDNKRSVEAILACPVIKDKLPLLKECSYLQYKYLDIFFTSYRTEKIINKLSTDVLKFVISKFQEHFPERFYVNYKEIYNKIRKKEIKDFLISLKVLKELKEV